MSQKRFLFYLLIISALLSYITYYGPAKKRAEKTVKKSSPAAQLTEIVIDFTKPNALQEWKPHTFNKNTIYEIKDTGTEKYLNATSDMASSALFHEVNLDMATKPVFVWKWRVEKFPAGKKNVKFLSGDENDFAGRIYVVFEGRNRFSHDVIQYIWDDHFPEGTHADNSSLNRVKAMVVRSGPADASGAWAEERRDLTKDYEMLYGKSPAEKRLLIIGLMSDSDDTKAQTETKFKDFRFQFPSHVTSVQIRTKKEKSSPFSFVSKIPSKTKDFGEFVFEKTTTLGGVLPSKEKAEDSKKNAL